MPQVENVCTWPHVISCTQNVQNYSKHCIKLSGCMCKVYMKEADFMFRLWTHPQNISLFIGTYARTCKKSEILNTLILEHFG